MTSYCRRIHGNYSIWSHHEKTTFYLDAGLGHSAGPLLVVHACALLLQLSCQHVHLFQTDVNHIFAMNKIQEKSLEKFEAFLSFSVLESKLTY
jgi:hypothetical protein